MKLVRLEATGHGLRIDSAAVPDYLDEVGERMPPGARAFAAAAWHYDPRDPRCPHDAWVQSLQLVERDEGGARVVDLVLRLLGAYHDGELELVYAGVARYSVGAALGPRGHGDWITDELTLEDGGLVLHEIALETGTWTIACRDVAARWIARES